MSGKISEQKGKGDASRCGLGLGPDFAHPPLEMAGLGPGGIDVLGGRGQCGLAETVGFEIVDELLQMLPDYDFISLYIPDKRDGCPKKGISSNGSDQGKERSTGNIPFPEKTQRPEKEQGGIEGIEVHQMLIGQNPCLAGSLGQTVLVHDSITVVLPGCFAVSRMLEQGVQFLEHHGPGIVGTAPGKPKPETLQMLIAGHHWTPCSPEPRPFEPMYRFHPS